MLEFLRKDLILILAMTAVIVSISYAIGFVTKSPANNYETQPAFIEGDRAPKAQSATSRTWKEHSFDKVLTLGSAKVITPEIMQVANSGDLYVLDWADLKIKRFSTKGDLLNVFGSGKGKTEAGAFINPTGFSITANGELWVCDPPQRKLTHFKPDGTAQALEMRKGLYRVLVLGDSLVTMAPLSTTGLFEVYNLSGTQLRAFGEFLQNQSEQGTMLDGEITGDEGGGFVYGGRHLGVIAGYNEEGVPRFVAHTIDGNALPKVQHVEGRVKVKPNSIESILSISTVGNYLYVLSATRTNNGKGGQVMDVYDKRTGDYVYSLQLPIPCRDAVVHADMIYALGDEGITGWRFRQSS